MRRGVREGAWVCICISHTREWVRARGCVNVRSHIHMPEVHIACAQMRAHVASGQLEFVGGGWVQNDEANPDYAAVVAQTLREVNEA